MGPETLALLAQGESAYAHVIYTCFQEFKKGLLIGALACDFAFLIFWFLSAMVRQTTNSEVIRVPQ